MTRLSSILTSGAAAVGFLTSAMVLAQVPEGDTHRKRVIVTTPVSKGQAPQPAIADEMTRFMRRLRQLSKQLQPFYRFELMHVRTACALTKEQLHRIRPELDAAYEQAIIKIAARNDEVLRSADAEDIDYSAAIREAVLSVVERHVTPEQRAACDDDLRLRQQGRKEAGVEFLVATIDRELLLTDPQRCRLAESLSAHWDDHWCDALELTLGGRMAIPRIPDRLVTPGLSVTQQESWRRIPRFQNRLWGVNIDHGGDPAQAQELGEDAKASRPGVPAARNVRRGKTG